MPPVLPATRAEVTINMVTDDAGVPFYQRHLDRYWTQFRNARLTDFPPQQFDDVVLGETPRKGLYITGPTGTGKTHFLVAWYRAYATGDPLADIAIVNWLDMIDAIKAEFGKPEEARREPFYYKTLGVLLIDDFGKGQHTGWVIEQMYSILNARWTGRKLTYITSNHPISEVEDWGGDGEAIASRLRGLCNELVMLGEDRRK